MDVPGLQRGWANVTRKSKISATNRSTRVTLTPKLPPGRPNRKALAFAAEIARLHSHGYSCEAIRLTLSEVGLVVSRSTVTREVARWAKNKRSGEAAGIIPRVVAIPGPRTPDTQPASSPPAGPHYGQRVAASWMDGRITNPLFRARTPHENSRH